MERPCQTPSVVAYYATLPGLPDDAIDRGRLHAPLAETARTWRHWAWYAASLAAFCGGVYFYRLGGLALFEPDEGRNAEIAREILRLHDWVTPHYDFVPYLDKPILFYALVAAAFKVFGVSEWAARLPSTLAALGCVLLVFDLSRARGQIRTGLWSALFLATSPLFVAFARISIFDMTLTMFVTLALWAFARAIAAPSPGRDRWLIVMSVAMGLAMLTKGPIGVVLPAMVIVMWAAVTKRWSWLRAPGLAIGVAAFVLLVVPWYAWAEWRNPGYLHYFFVEENLLRYLTPRFHKSEPWYFYAIVIGLGTFPWSALLVPLWRDRKTTAADEHTRLLWIWAAIPILFFSASSSKLPGYVLPSLPPLALLFGAAAARQFGEASPRSRWMIALPSLSTLLVLAGIVVALFVPAIVPGTLSEDSGAIWNGVRQQARGVLSWLLILPCAGVVVSLRARAQTCFVVAAVSCAVVYALAIEAAGPVSERSSSRLLAAEARPQLRGDDQLVVYDAYFSSLPFYLRVEQPMWNVWLGTGDEIMGSPYVKETRPASALGTGDVVWDVAEFTRVWGHAPTRMVAVVRADRVDRFIRQVGGSPIELLRVGSAVLFADR